MTPERTPDLLRRAFHNLRTGRPGPVLLEVPADVAVAPFPQPAGADADAGGALTYRPVPRRRTMGDPADIAAVTQALLDARRPLVVAGQGVLYAGASAALVRLAEALGAPVATTILGKSAFPEDHPLALGVMAGSGTDAAAHFLGEADLVLAIGTSLSSGLMVSPIPPGKVLIQCTVDERDLEKTYALDHAILGDARLVLEQLLEEVAQRRGGAGEGESASAAQATPAALAATRAEVGRLRAQWEARWAPELASDSVPLSPYRVIGELMQVVDLPTTIVTHDSGQPRGQLAPIYRATAPHSYLGWGNSTQLGYGLGLAMGAALAAPQRLVVAFMGDAAFGMVGMDFETAVRARIPILALVVNNSLMGGHPRVMPVATERYGASSLSGDYAGVARALGGYAERVEAPADVRPALERGRTAVQGGRPALLEFITRP